MNLSSPSTTLICPFFNQEYPTFPNLWKPQQMPFLFIVRAPQSLTELDEKTYLELIQTRLDRLIQAWVDETSLAETQRLLASSLNQLDSAQVAPHLTSNPVDNQDNSSWRQAWANLFIHDNWRFQERMGHYEVTFPLTLVKPNSSDYFDWIATHNETTLEEWLITLMP